MHGELIAKSEGSTENIHVINRTSGRFTVTDALGAFVIPIKLHDTLSFSSIQYKPQELIISEQILESGVVVVTLETQVNELDEVIVGKVLTGDLLHDVKNTEGKAPINFYDLGIPGYTGKLATQSERRLHEATTGGGILPLNPIINAITGRTKMLKEHILIEKKNTLMQSIKSRLSKDFFHLNPLLQDYRMDYFYFCLDDANFLERCQNKTDFEVWLFLEEKYTQYMKNKREDKD